MQKRLLGSIVTLLAAVTCSYALFAQNSAKSAGAASQGQVLKTSWGEPDFSGMWEPHMPRSAPWGIYGLTGEIPEMTPWGKEQYEKTKPSWGPRAVDDSTDPVNPTTGHEVGCLPTGVPRIYTHPFPMKIIQTQGVVYQLFEFNHFVREIYTNEGREHPKDIDPSWMGNSVGWWEGNTLVIDSIGFNDKTWVDRAGLPHSDQLHVVERFTRPTHDKLRLDVTVDDPKTYTHTWTGWREWELEPGWHLTEMICEDNITFNDLKNAGKEQ